VLLDDLDVPIVLAPLAGGPSTPRLTAAVCEAGGLGFLATGYLSGEQTAAALKETRALTGRPVGVNLFSPGDGPADPAGYEPYLRRIGDWAAARDMPIGVPEYREDDWEQKLELLLGEPVEAVSFTFGCPSRETLARLKEVGTETWVTVTSPQEAREAAAAGADVLVVQGAEAGGHRASFVDRPDVAGWGLLALLQAVRSAVETPLVATGGIASGAGLAAVLSAGARAAQLGSAFMLAPEAGTSQAHRQALKSDAPTALTRAFTGRLARGIRNSFMSDHEGAPVAYPEIHYVTAPLRKRARELGDSQSINLWAGEAHALAQELPAAEIVAGLIAEAEAALASAARRLRTAPQPKAGG
jgi:nitronate monooxygenase